MPSRRGHLVLIAPLALVLLPFLVLPALVGLVSSFTDYAPLRGRVHIVGWANYAAVLQDPQMRAAFRNIAVLVAAAVPAELLAGLAIASALRAPFRGRGAVRVLLLVPWAVSPVAAGVMWHFLYSAATGLPNFWLAWLRVPPQPSPLGLPACALAAVIAVDVWRKAPLAGFLLLPGVRAIPADLWEQAALDGASPAARLRHLIVPWTRPLLGAVAVVLLADALGTFETVLMMTGGGPGATTITPALYGYQQAWGAGNWPAGVAAAWLVAAGVLLAGAAYLLAARRAGSDPGDPDAWPGAREEGGREARRPRARWARGALVGGLVLATLLPLAWTVLASLEIVPDDAARPPSWTWPPSAEQYAALLAGDPTFRRAFATSLALSAATTALAVALAFLAAYGLSRSRVRGARVLVQGLLVLAVLPALAYVIPLSDLVRRLHLHDTAVGVTLASAAAVAPLAVFLLYGYVERLPPALEEMARLDGASLPRTLWACVLRSAAPGLAAAGALTFILSWNLFLVPLALALPRIRTVTVALSDVFLFERDLEWPRAAAALVIALLPAVALVATGHRALERLGPGPSGAGAPRSPRPGPPPSPPVPGTRGEGPGRSGPHRPGARGRAIPSPPRPAGRGPCSAPARSPSRSPGRS